MKIVVLDEYTLNPGELYWESFEAIRKITIYKRAPSKKIF